MEAVRTASCASSALFLDNLVDTHLSEAPGEHVHQENVRKMASNCCCRPPPVCSVSPTVIPPWPRAVPTGSLPNTLEEGLSSSVSPQQDLGSLCLSSAPSPAIRSTGDQDQPLHLTSKPPGGTRGARATVAAPCRTPPTFPVLIGAGGRWLQTLFTLSSLLLMSCSALALWHPRW